MKKVFQTRHGIYGDCMPACVASIMEIPMKGMLRIKATSMNWAHRWQKFLKPYDLGLLWYMARGHKRPRGYAIAAHRIRGNKKRYFHAVVYKDGKKIHDPYPQGKKSRELLGIEYWIVFTVLDASKVKKRRLTKYKYRVEARPSGRDLADWLNEHAADGWRLVQVAPGPSRDYFTGTQESLYYFEGEVPEVEFKESVGDLNKKMLDL